MSRNRVRTPIIFNGKPIFGTAEAVVAEMPPLQVQRTYYWGLHGTSEVVGETTGRELTCGMWLHRRYNSRLSVEAGIKEINSWIGQHGTLKELDWNHGIWIQYQDVTFHGFERQAIGGRGSADPIFDYARTVDSGWIQAGVLHFFQLVT